MCEWWWGKVSATRYRTVGRRESGEQLGWAAFGLHMDKGKARQCRSCAAYKCLIYASKMLDSQPKRLCQGTVGPEGLATNQI